MPYIKQERRKALSPHLRAAGKAIENPGDLNYAITLLAKLYLAREPMNYQRINDVLGAMEGAKMELYRRAAVPYEEGKIKENGDVEC